MKKLKLKPCPFCGWKPTTKAKAGLYSVACEHDDCLIRPHVYSFGSLDHAAGYWNTRKGESK